MNRVLLICHPDYDVRNLKSVVRILLDNDYSLQFIFSTMTERIKALANKKTALNKNITLSNMTVIVIITIN